MKKQRKLDGVFVYVVDSYASDGLNQDLEAFGLIYETNFYVTGAGGAEIIFAPGFKKQLGSKKLLVFMSTFYGSAEPAIELSKQIKTANPNAKIILRSNVVHQMNPVHRCDPVFDESMQKGDDDSKLLEVVKKFLAEKPASVK